MAMHRGGRLVLAIGLFILAAVVIGYLFTRGWSFLDDPIGYLIAGALVGAGFYQIARRH